MAEGFRDWEQHLLSILSRASAFRRAFRDPSVAKLWSEGMLLGFINNFLATSSPPSLQSPSSRVIEFSFPLEDPNLKRSIRSGTNSLLLLISSSPLLQPRSRASTAKASSVIPAFSSTSRSMSNGIAPARTTLTLLTLYSARLNSAVAASFFAAEVPSPRSPTKAGMAFG